MPRVADFVTFSDKPFDLQLGSDIDETLTEIIEEQPQSGEGGLLTWNVRREGSGSVSYQIRVNNDNQTSYTVSETNWHSVQEVISTSDLKQGENTVEFIVTSGTGRLSIGDVTLFYRKNIGLGIQAG